MLTSMREPTYFLLLALSEGPRHGYAIAGRAKELSEERVTLTAGTLYGALDRLEGAGHVVVDREETVQGRKRRYYRLTEDGHGALLAEVARLQAAVATADRVIGLAGSGGIADAGAST